MEIILEGNAGAMYLQDYDQIESEYDTLKKLSR
jgi:hypothetical protein